MTTYTFSPPTKYFQQGAGAEFYKFGVVIRSGNEIPASHMADAQHLEGDAYVELFQILLSDKATKIFQKVDKGVTWQGDTYEGVPIQITGVEQTADDETARPQLMLFNPNKVYSSLVNQGLLEGAMVSRYRVLKQHVEADLPIYRRQSWKIARVASVKGEVIACEMRDMLDGQVFQTPPRMYIPPEFPAVSLS